MVGERDEPASAPGAFDATIGGPEDRLALLASTLRPAGETSGDEDDDGSEEAPELARGDLVGRYVVLSRIGTSSMSARVEPYHRQSWIAGFCISTWTRSSRRSNS